MYRVILVGTMLLAALQPQNQHEQHSPYAAQERSEIAALTVEELAGLREGAGMGLARAAELNGYPGPKHVLELTGELGLSAQQRGAIETIFDRMHEQAIELGEQVLERERQLDRRFAHKHIDADLVNELTAEIGRLRGMLRAAHLQAHIETTALLADEQVRRYEAARGYAETTVTGVALRRSKGPATRTPDLPT